MRFGSSNYVFKKILNSDATADYQVATYQGIARKTAYFLFMTLIGAAASIGLFYYNPDLLSVLLIPSGLVTFIAALIAMMSPGASRVSGTIYCLSEGMLIGLISLVFSTVASGAVSAALLSTIAVFAVVTTLFTSNIVKVNGKFTKFLLMFAISFIVSQLLLMLVMMITGNEYGLDLQLILSLIATFLATLYLFFDLENIRRVVEGNYPKVYEWYASFGLVFTLLWLYVEILRIAVIIAGRRD